MLKDVAVVVVVWAGLLQMFLIQLFQKIFVGERFYSSRQNVNNSQREWRSYKLYLVAKDGRWLPCSCVAWIPLLVTRVVSAP